MATLALNKMKSKLTTRNSFTGRAMERMTKEKLFELFNGDLNYMSWEQTYIQRRFHSQQYLDKIRKQRRETLQKETQKHINNQNENRINLTSMLQNEEKHDIELQQRFNTFITKHNGNKPLLILDVDNTMIYVRFFSEELRIGDICTYFGNYAVVEKDNSKIIKIRLTLSLEITNNELIDVFGSERAEHFYWTNANDDIKKYKKNHMFEYPLNTNTNVQFIQCKIRKVEISACIIEVFNDDVREEIEIDFTAENDKLNKFEPPLQRHGMVPVDFIYEGFLVRLRPNLDEFMEYIQDEYDVVLYTSANKIIYNGLVKQLHIFINETLGRDNNNSVPLWNDVLFRDDCILKYDYKGKPYHQKDLSLFGCDLSRVIMVDNSPIVCHGQEPNLILISDFFGKDEEDDELMEVYQLLDAIGSIKGDIRYFLCGLEDEQQISLTDSVDLSTEHKCLHLTMKLIDTMKAYYNDQINIFSDANTEPHSTVISDGMMDDFDMDEFKTTETTSNIHFNIAIDSIDSLSNSTSISQIQAEQIFDDLQLNIITATDAQTELDDMEETPNEQYVNDDILNIQTRDRNGSTFIPPKHGKNDSIVSIRDLDVIKLEKAQKRKVSFYSDTDFENKGKAAATPTRKRKRSSILNSMAPKPSSRDILQNSQHEDFFVVLLKQLTNKIGDEHDKAPRSSRSINNDIRKDIMQKNKKTLLEQKNEIMRLRNELEVLDTENNEKSIQLNRYSKRESEYESNMEIMRDDVNKYKDMIELRNNNRELLEQLKSVGGNISMLTQSKNELQDTINDVIEKKIKYIKTVNDEIEHYRQLIKQIATNELTVTLSVE